jgi:hypothetical protein
VCSIFSYASLVLRYDGEGHEGVIWLSILGEVYDVTKGAGYYKKGMGYSVFAARDGSVPFITGNFTAEEAKKSILDTLSDAQLYALNDWRNFYEGEEKYPFLGLLQGEFFDEDGGPTETMTKIRTMIRNYVPRSVQRKKERDEKKAAAAAKAREEMGNLAAAADSVAKGVKESVEPMAPKQGGAKDARDDDDDPSPKTGGVKGVVSSNEGEL